MITRRRLLFAGAGFAIGCTRADAAPASCADTTGLSADEQKARMTLGYVEPSTRGEKTCALCTQFVPAPASGQCGSCKLLKGPVHPRGYCKAFAAKG